MNERNGIYKRAQEVISNSGNGFSVIDVKKLKANLQELSSLEDWPLVVEISGGILKLLLSEI